MWEFNMPFHRGFWQNAKGNVTIMMAFAILPLGLAVGAAVDMSRVNYVKTVLQGAADAAAMAGGVSKNKSDAALKKTVEAYLRANHSEDVLEFVTKIDRELNSNNGTFRVTINGTFPTSFMSLAGFDKMDVGATAVVNVGSQALELALVLDNTGSMAGTKTANLIAAATNLVNIIQQESSGNADTDIAVVPFAEYVNVGVSRLGENWIDQTSLGGKPFTGCVGSRNAPHDEKSGAAGGGDYPALADVPCNVELLPLTSDLNAVKAKIATMVATGATYIPTGLLWGWNILDSNEPFTEGRTISQMKKINGRKAIVLMTDGENTISPSYPKHEGSDPAVSNTKLEDMCKAVKQDNIEIFTVSFMVPSDTIKDILIECASSPAQYFDADNGAELNAAFQQIARDLATVRLTQ
jgi:Flp pilus assembly protein TadG